MKGVLKALQTHALCKDKMTVQAVYTALREAEHRSTAPIPYWNLPFATYLVPRQAQCREAMQIINTTLDSLIAKCQRLVSRFPKLLIVSVVPGLSFLSSTS